MKHLLLAILLMTSLLPVSAQKTFELSNPITLGMLLVDDSDQSRMEEICRHYNLRESQSENGYSVFTFNDGSQIRFKVEEISGATTKTPVIEITLSNKNTKAAEILLSSGYRKASTPKGLATYKRGSTAANRHTVCTQTSSRTYLFTKSTPGNESKW